jgi:hypothetical protein
MMKKILRIAAAVLAIVMLLTAAVSCRSKQEKQEQTVVGTCGGFDVLYEELRYVTLTYKEMFESTYGKGIWDDPESAEKYRAELEETVMAMLCNNYAVLAACAHYMPHGTLDNDTIQQAVDREVEAARAEYGGETEFAKAMAEMHMTEHFLRFCIGVAELENELRYVLTYDLGVIENDEAKFAEWLNEGNFAYVQHVFIRNDAGDDPAQNLEHAQEVRRMLIQGTPIGEIINSSVNEDTSNTAPYFLVRDVYTKELEEAALSLHEDGAVSRVADSGEGYYVFQRIPYETSLLTKQLPELLYSWQWAKVEDVVNEYKKELRVELNEYGKSIDLLAIK